MIPIATALINGRPVTLEEKDGYYFYTFTADTQTVDIQHLGCIGETQITELQIEKNDHQTYYVPPDVTYHPMAELLREMTHVRLELTDPESDFRSSLLLTNQGLLTQFENGPTMSALKQTAASYERRFEGMEDGKTLVNYVQETKDGILSVLTSTTAKLVKSQEEEYYLSTSQTAQTGGTWQTSIPTRTTGQSIWRRYRDVYADGTKSAWKPSVNGVNITGDKGDQGVQGLPGPKGTDGKTSYTHIAYANSADGRTGFSVTDSNREYIGMYVDFNQTGSSSPADYHWTKVKGADGSQGTPGPKGADGRTPYLHIAYATNSTGTTGFSTTDSVGKTYIGQYTDFVQADSTDPSRYKWTLIQGPKGDKGDAGERGLQGLQGPKGDQGLQGPKGVDGRTSYTHIAYANSADGRTGFSVSDPNREYIGMYVDFNQTDSSNPADYHWTKVKGADGAQGVPGVKGADGRTPYLHIAYATNSTGTDGFSTTDSVGKTYIGQYTDYIQSDSTNPSSYKWTLIQGPKGDQGTKGRGITAVVMEYGKSTSNTVPPSSWVSTPPQANVYPTKEYVWEREKITWDMAPTTTYTSPRLSEVGNLARDFRVVNDTVTAYERIMGGTDDQGRLTRLTQQLQTNAGFKQAVTDKISGTETRVTQLAESWSVKHLNANGDVLTAINVATGGASIQAGSNKLVVTPTTTYIQNGTIKSAMIESLDASKITAGTLDASKANIANLNINSLVGNKSEFIRSGWNAINSRVSIDGTGLKVTHTDGSYTMIGANGLEMYIGSTGYRTNFLTNAYMITGVHNTQHLETYNKHRYDGMSFGHYIYTLPTVYRGRNYSAICSLSDVQFYDTASWVLQRVVSYVDQSRTLELRPYGKVAIVAYAIYVNTSSFALKSYPVSVSLTVTV